MEDVEKPASLSTLLTRLVIAVDASASTTAGVREAVIDIQDWAMGQAVKAREPDHPHQVQHRHPDTCQGVVQLIAACGATPKVDK